MYPATLHLNGKRKQANPIYVGDDYTHEIVFLDENDGAVDKSSVTILAQVRRTTSSETVSAEFNSAVGGVGNNVVTLSIPAAETATLEPGDYVWDYQETEGGITTTRLKGEVLVVGDVSRAA